MCQTTHAANKQENTGRVTRVCRWYNRKKPADVVWYLQNGLGQILEVEDTDRHGVTRLSFYMVSRIESGVWRLEKGSPDGSEPQAVYTVNTHHEDDVSWWTCECGDYRYRKAQIKEPCRHISMLRNALARLGVDPLA